MGCPHFAHLPDWRNGLCGRSAGMYSDAKIETGTYYWFDLLPGADGRGYADRADAQPDGWRHKTGSCCTDLLCSFGNRTCQSCTETSSTSSMSRMAYAETRFKEGTASANAEMKRTESRFSKETTVSSSASSSTSSQASSSASSSTSNIRVLRAPGAVQRGNVAQLSIQGKGNIQYKIKVIYDSGNTGKGSEMSVQSDTFGRASWAWTVGKDIAPGAHFITITGGGETLTTSFTTT